MEEKGADGFVLTSLDDIAWLLNIRGGDVHCCPVVLSYLIMTKTEIRLFANEKAFSASILDALSKDGVTILPYDSIYEYVKTFEKDMTVLLCKKKANCRLVNSIPKEVTILDEANLTFLPKSIKNPVEVENERIAHIKDGVALTKFICWLKKNVGKIPITELSAGEKLYSFRAQQENFIDNSLTPLFLMAFMLQSTIILPHQRQILPLSLAISFWQTQADTITKVLQIPPAQLLWLCE